MTNLNPTLKNICEEAVKALAEADSNLRQLSLGSIEGNITLDITFHGIWVDGIEFEPYGDTCRENEISIKGIRLNFTSSSRHHVPDN